jgi:hypothetical protein
MRATFICHIALLAAASAVAGSVNAEYRCNSQAMPADKGACAAAQKGPDALRQYVQRMRAVQPLDFFEYVNKETLIAWEEKEQRERAEKIAAQTPSPGLAHTSAR